MQDEKPVCWCERCGGEIYDAEGIWVIADETLCYDCMKEAVSDD